jgi:hypothetical protein
MNIYHSLRKCGVPFSTPQLIIQDIIFSHIINSMQVSQTDRQTVTTSKSVASNSSKLTWRDIQGLSWVFEDDW